MKHKIIFISGERDSGKTSMAYSLCSRLDLDGKSVGGVMQVLSLPGEEKTTYTLTSDVDGSSIIMLDREEHEGWEACGRFFCNPEAFFWAESQFNASYDKDVMVFDEIGRFEMEGRGFDTSFSDAVDSYKGYIMAIVRDEFLEAVCSRYAIDLNSCIVIGSHDDKEDSYTRIQTP